MIFLNCDSISFYEGFEETYFSKFHFSHLQNADHDPTIEYTHNFLMKIYLFILRFYLFIRESGQERASTGRQNGRQRQREKQAPGQERNQMRDLIPGRWDHDLSQRQLLNQLSHPGVPFDENLICINNIFAVMRGSWKTSYLIISNNSIRN